MSFHILENQEIYPEFKAWLDLDPKVKNFSFSVKQLNAIYKSFVSLVTRIKVLRGLFNMMPGELVIKKNNVIQLRKDYPPFELSDGTHRVNADSLEREYYTSLKMTPKELLKGYPNIYSKIYS